MEQEIELKIEMARSLFRNLEKKTSERSEDAIRNLEIRERLRR